MSAPMLEIRNLAKFFPIRNAFGKQTGEVRYAFDRDTSWQREHG